LTIKQRPCSYVKGAAGKRFLTARILKGIVYRIVDNAERSIVVKTISANELKTKGVASIDSALKEQEEAIISVRGKDRYVVMDMETYNRLRVCELEAALYQARREVAEGEGIEEGVEEHLERLKKLES
jgi:PHD/YefM family antitoxin component YafN of YafNO toxin-antitoxin module